MVQRELVDPAGLYWGTAEINSYLNEWQEILQSRFEFTWGSTTITNALSTLTLSNIIPNALRLDAIYFVPGTWTKTSGTSTTVVVDPSIRRLSPRSLIDLDFIQRDWRALGSNPPVFQPEVSYQNDPQSVSFWPPPPGTGTYIFEYPLLTTFATDTSIMVIPAWTRYSAAAYCCYKAQIRFGANQDIPKAQRRLRQWNRMLKRYQKIYDNYFPERAEMLRPGRNWAANILIPRQQTLQVP